MQEQLSFETTAFPSTPQYERLIKIGRLLSEHWYVVATVDEVPGRGTFLVSEKAVIPSFSPDDLATIMSDERTGALPPSCVIDIGEPEESEESERPGRPYLSFCGQIRDMAPLLEQLLEASDVALRPPRAS